MTKTIALVVGERYRHYLSGVEKRLVVDGYRIAYYEPEAFCKLDDFSSVDCVVTVHSIDQELLEALSKLKGKVPTVTLQDGLIEYAHCCLKEGSVHRYRPIATDYLLTFGERPKQIVALRCDTASIVATGSPRFDAYQQYKTGLPDPKLPVLVTTANTPWQDKQSKKAFSRLFVQLLGTLNDLGVKFKLRLPDKVRKELMLSAPIAYRRAVKTEFAQGISKTDTSLLEDILGSSAVITTPSTVALEAMILERPTAILQTGFYPMYLESAFQLVGKDSFLPVLSCLASRDSDFADRYAFQQLIKQENAIDDGRATERVVEIVESLLN